MSFLFIFIQNGFWMFNNVTLMTNMKYTVIPTRDVRSVPRYETALIVHNVQKNDFGEYQCYITNQYGTSFVRIPLEKRSNNNRDQ